MAIDLLPTGIAATALTALSRVAEAAIRRSANRRNGTGHNALEIKISRLEATIKEMEEQATYDDLRYRLNTLEVIARRHGWEIPFRSSTRERD